MRALLAMALLVTAALAGCSDDKDSDGGGASATTTSTGAQAQPPVLLLNVTAGNATYRFASAGPSGHAGHHSASGTTTVPSGNGTAGAGNGTGNATTPSGPAPLNVTFELAARGLPAAAQVRWTLDLGRGAANATGNASREGKSLPATLSHTYTAPGDYNVTYVLHVGNFTPQALQATLHIGNGTGNVSVTKPLPDQVHFEFGESLGCASDANALTSGAAPPNCVSFQGGPAATGVDGHWLELGEGYWGLAFVATSANADGSVDSDCFLLAPDAATILGDGHNGGDPCGGIVPEGTGWIFLYPWAVPATGMTLDFSLAEE